jgi:hypothetical protein
MKSIRICSAFVAIALTLSVNILPLGHGMPITQAAAQADSSTGSVDATQAWNQVCAYWEFPAAPHGGTLLEAWNSVPNHHKNFLVALNGITAEINYILASNQVPGDDDDVMNFRVQNWGLN